VAQAQGLTPGEPTDLENLKCLPEKGMERAGDGRQT
jgi:hypothetical protein